MAGELPIQRRRTVVVSRKRTGARVEKTRATRERQQQALELRKTGATYDQIAQSLGYKDASAARKAVVRGMEVLQIESAKDVVMMDLQRLDEFQMRCTAALRQNGDLAQIDRLMRIMEMRYRLLGVSARTVEQLQEAYGISNPTNITNKGVMVIQSAAHSQEDFIKQMMAATGVDPDSDVAKKYLANIGKPKSDDKRNVKTKEVKQISQFAELNEDEIVDAEILDEME